MERIPKKYYFDHGCEGIWNDNNEIELEDSELPAYYTRSVYPVMMSKASYEGLKTIAPISAHTYTPAAVMPVFSATPELGRAIIAAIINPCITTNTWGCR